MVAPCNPVGRPWAARWSCFCGDAFHPLPTYAHTQITAGLLRHAARGGGAASDAEIKADVARSLAWLEAATKPLPPV